MQKVVNVTSVGVTGETVYAISWQQSSGHVLDYVDDLYKAVGDLAADVDACYPLMELTIGTLSTKVYEFYIADNPLKPWKSDYYTFVVYNQVGASPDPSLDDIVGAATLVVQNDKIVEQFHSYPGL